MDFFWPNELFGAKYEILKDRFIIGLTQLKILFSSKKFRG